MVNNKEELMIKYYKVDINFNNVIAINLLCKYYK